MEELHLCRKDFHIEWYGGTGGGSQHRSTHDNCCRITHIETGIKAQCAAYRERSANRREAFQVLAARLLDHYAEERSTRRQDGSLVRTYHGVRKEVIDKVSGHRMSYRKVVVDGNIGEMIEAQRSAMTIGSAGD